MTGLKKSTKLIISKNEIQTVLKYRQT